MTEDDRLMARDIYMRIRELQARIIRASTVCSSCIKDDLVKVSNGLEDVMHDDLPGYDRDTKHFTEEG